MVDKRNWTSREQDWYEMEEKLLFKNNAQSVENKDKSDIDKWHRAILK
jgi:hypothetical protein